MDPAWMKSARLVLALRQAGVTDKAVLNAMETTPREPFAPSGYEDLIYDDVTLPIDCGQEISKPSDIGRMLQALAVDKTCSVLEIGAGSGYQAVVLSRMVKRVFTMDRYRTLTVNLRAVIESLGVRNVEVRRADGLGGWPEAAPFERIILTGSVKTVPDEIFAQLAIGGILVAPIELEDGQVLVRYVRNDAGDYDERALGPSKFLPLIPGVAKEL